MDEILIKNGIQLTIRNAGVSDAGAILEYINKIAGESDNLTFGPGEFNISKKEEKQFLESITNTKNSIFIIGIVDDMIVSVGNFTGGKRKRIEHFGEIGLSVMKKYWRLGIGLAMMNFIIIWAKNSKIIRKLNLQVKKENIAAIALYEKLGFKKEGLQSRTFKIDGNFYDTIYYGLEID